MDINDFVRFCRDFEFIPNLLTKAQIFKIWLGPLSFVVPLFSLRSGSHWIHFVVVCCFWLWRFGWCRMRLESARIPGRQHECLPRG